MAYISRMSEDDFIDILIPKYVLVLFCSRPVYLVWCRSNFFCCQLHPLITKHSSRSVLFVACRPFQPCLYCIWPRSVLYFVFVAHLHYCRKFTVTAVIGREEWLCFHCTSTFSRLVLIAYSCTCTYVYITTRPWWPLGLGTVHSLARYQIKTPRQNIKSPPLYQRCRMTPRVLVLFIVRR